MRFAAKTYITYPLRGYVSEEARVKIKRVVAAGIDLDLAFAMVEADMPEQEFYDLEVSDE